MKYHFWLITLLLFSCSQSQKPNFDKLRQLGDSIEAKNIEISKFDESALFVTIHDSKLAGRFLEQDFGQNLSKLDSTFYLSVDIGRKIHLITMHHFDYDKMLLSYQFNGVEEYDFALNFNKE